MRIAFIWFCFTAVLASAPVAANEAPEFDFRNWTVSEDIEKYRMELHKLYSECSRTAIQREMSLHEATICAEVYTRLKLSFIPGSDYDRYKTLSPKTRAIGNAKGYTAYRAWLHRHVTAGTMIASSDDVN